MNFWKQKKNIFLLLILVLFLGFALRKHNLHTWPRLGATFDEYAWTWQGINLIQKGKPISWSPHSQYKNKKLVIYQNTPFWIASPFLEHPPLFGLIAGSYALVNGATDMYHLTLFNIRGLALLLGVLSIFLIFIFAAENYGYKIGLLSALLYATVPTVAIGSRIVQNENFFIPLLLFSLFLITKFIKTNKSWFRNLAAVISGLLILAKVPWIASSLGIVLILLFFKRYKDIFLFLAIVVPIFFIYIIYGIYYDYHLFYNLWFLQLNRYDLGFTSIYALFQKPFLVDRYYLDGWILFGWISFLFLFLKDLKKHVFIIFPFLAYFLIFIFAIPDEPSHGWYRYPFYPFLIISIALFLKEYFAKNWLLTFFFLVFVGLSLFNLTFVFSFGFSLTFFRLVLLGFSICLIPQFFPRFSKPVIVLSYIWIIIFFALSSWSVWIYNEQ